MKCRAGVVLGLDEVQVGGDLIWRRSRWGDGVLVSGRDAGCVMWGLGGGLWLYQDWIGARAGSW